jgi:hypothetical protein
METSSADIQPFATQKLNQKPRFRSIDSFFNFQDQTHDDLRLKLNVMSDDAILQINSTIIQPYNESECRKHLKALWLFYHPDKNPNNQEKAKIVFQLIGEASARLKLDPVHRDQYNIGPLSPDWWESYVYDQLASLDDLSIRVQALLEPNTSAVIIPGDSCIKIASSLKTIWRDRMVHEDVLAKQHDVLRALKKTAKTGEDFYAIFEILNILLIPRICLEDNNPNSVYSVHSAMQDAAKFKHPVAMRMVAGSALSGLIIPVNESIPWTIHCLYYLEHVTIPALCASNTEQDNNFLKLIQSGIERAKQRIVGIDHNNTLPAPGTKDFEALVTQTVDNVSQVKLEAFYTTQFTLSTDLFYDNKLEHTPDSEKILQRTGTIAETDPSKIITTKKTFDAYLSSLDSLIKEQPHGCAHTEYLVKFKTSMEECFNQFHDDCSQGESTPDTLVLKQTIDKSIEETMGALERESSLWEKLHPIIKGILGVFAALFIIPAVIVQVTAPRGYWGTFFTPYKREMTTALIIDSGFGELALEGETASSTLNI